LIRRRRMKEREETELEGSQEASAQVPAKDILEEIEVEDLTVDGICGVY
jgi:mycofactocin precursor